MSASITPALTLVRHPEFRRGAREMLGTSLGIGAWGLVTGVAMIDSGLGVPLSLAMTLLVFAGSSQLASLPLLTTGAPIWVILATAFCVNLRFLVFSAQWRPYFAHFKRGRRLVLAYLAGDMSYVMFMRRFPRQTPEPNQLPYFLGGATTNWICWQVPSIAGILLADRVPVSWGLGFAGTLALLGLVYSLLVDRATWVAAVVAGAAAIASFALPLRLNIVVAIAAAVAAGLLMERRPPGSGPPEASRSSRGERLREAASSGGPPARDTLTSGA